MKRVFPSLGVVVCAVLVVALAPQLSWAGKQAKEAKQAEVVADFVQFPRRGSTRIEIIFPSERPYHRYEALRGAAPMEDRGLDSAFVEDQRGIVEDKTADGRPLLVWEIENPPHRARHRLVWEW